MVGGRLGFRWEACGLVMGGTPIRSPWKRPAPKQSLSIGNCTRPPLHRGTYDLFIFCEFPPPGVSPLNVPLLNRFLADDTMPPSKALEFDSSSPISGSFLSPCEGIYEVNGGCR